EPEILGHRDPRHSALELPSPAEVRAGLRAFERNIADHFGRVYRMRLDEVLGSGRGERALGIHAIGRGRPAVEPENAASLERERRGGGDEIPDDAGIRSDSDHAVNHALSPDAGRAIPALIDLVAGIAIDACRIRAGRGLESDRAVNAIGSVPAARVAVNRGDV